VESQDHKFWFYVDNIHGCVEGWMWASIIKHPSLPFIWLVMLCTNLTTSEIWTLNNQVFIYQDIDSHLNNTQGAWHLSKVMIITSTSIRQVFSKWDGKLVCHTKLGEFHGCRWEFALILHLIDVPPLGIGCVYIISTIITMLHGNVYDVIMGCYLVFICFDFVSMLSSFIEKKGKYVPCNHLHFIFARRMYFDPKVDLFVHRSTSR